jgi:hypothetical protein
MWTESLPKFQLLCAQTPVCKFPYSKVAGRAIKEHNLTKTWDNYASFLLLAAEFYCDLHHARSHDQPGWTDRTVHLVDNTDRNTPLFHVEMSETITRTETIPFLKLHASHSNMIYKCLPVPINRAKSQWLLYVPLSIPFRIVRSAHTVFGMDLRTNSD